MCLRVPWATLLALKPEEGDPHQEMQRPQLLTLAQVKKHCPLVPPGGVAQLTLWCWLSETDFRFLVSRPPEPYNDTRILLQGTYMLQQPWELIQSVTAAALVWNTSNQWGSNLTLAKEAYVADLMNSVFWCRRTYMCPTSTYHRVLCEGHSCLERLLTTSAMAELQDRSPWGVPLTMSSVAFHQPRPHINCLIFFSLTKPNTKERCFSSIHLSLWNTRNIKSDAAHTSLLITFVT